jgi:thiamine-phosphate pyrophosphorylase
MRLCLVTDRRRLAPAAAPFDASRRCLVAQARHAVAAGIDLIQVRERDLEAAELAALVTDLVALTRGTSTRVVVNDRLDVALACAADGVHLRADSMPVNAARRLAPDGFLIGRSIHGAGEAAQAAGADYVIAGTLFPSESKRATQALLGLDGLRAVVAAIPVPVLAIGGITEPRFEQVAAAGPGGIAAIGLFMGPGAGGLDSDRACRAIPLTAVVDRARAQFGPGGRR